MILDKRYFERNMMKQKEVEDVLGGADSWKNVDKTEGELDSFGCVLPPAQKRQADIQTKTLSIPCICGMLITTNTVNCKEEKCDNRSAYFRQVQIRSADEPMTTFYKVLPPATVTIPAAHRTDSIQCTLCAAEWREN